MNTRGKYMSILCHTPAAQIHTFLVLTLHVCFEIHPSISSPLVIRWHGMLGCDFLLEGYRESENVAKKKKKAQTLIRIAVERLVRRSATTKQQGATHHITYTCPSPCSRLWGMVACFMGVGVSRGRRDPQPSDLSQGMVGRGVVLRWGRGGEGGGISVGSTWLVKLVKGGDIDCLSGWPHNRGRRRGEGPLRQNRAKVNSSRADRHAVDVV